MQYEYLQISVSIYWCSQQADYDRMELGPAVAACARLACIGARPASLTCFDG